MGQAQAAPDSNSLPDMFKERSFCSPEDTQNAAAIGRLVREPFCCFAQVQLLGCFDGIETLLPALLCKIL